jgi:catechol 2,3-dioxygenase-like lactoylglutathione lyase family enzyme
MATFRVTRIGTILAVADIERSTAFYTRHLGFIVEATYDDPPYVTLIRNGVRLSFAEQGHPAEDRPGVEMIAPQDGGRLPVVLVLEVTDAAAIHEALVAEGAPILAEPFAPPWGGLRFFVVDPDGYLVEIEQPA